MKRKLTRYKRHSWQQWYWQMADGVLTTKTCQPLSGIRAEWSQCGVDAKTVYSWSFYKRKNVIIKEEIWAHFTVGILWNKMSYITVTRTVRPWSNVFFLAVTVSLLSNLVTQRCLHSHQQRATAPKKYVEVQRMNVGRGASVILAPAWQS